MNFGAAPFYGNTYEVINPLSEHALGSRTRIATGFSSSVGSMTWVANLAVFIPFGITRPFLVREVWWGVGSGGGNNIDVGVYDTAGTRIFSLGSTAQGGTSRIETSTTLTDVTLAPGDYYMAYACDGTTSDGYGSALTALLLAGAGVGQMASAFALPSSATIVPITNNLLPWFGLNGYTVTV